MLQSTFFNERFCNDIFELIFFLPCLKNEKISSVHHHFDYNSFRWECVHGIVSFKAGLVKRAT